jgi:hypothetical protein
MKQIAIVVLLSCATAYAADLKLVADGNPAATIVIPDHPTHWEQVGADWLQRYVLKSSGAKLAIVKESQSPAGTVISIGRTKLAADVATDDLQYDGCKLVARGSP